MKILSSKVIIALAMLLAQASLLSGCELPPVSNDQITRVNKAIVELMQNTTVHSLDAAGSVEKAYQDLSVYLRSNNLSNRDIEGLEITRYSLKGKAAKLREDLKKIRGQSDALFSLLRRRASDNKTPDLKEDLMTRIAYEEQTVNFSLKNVVDVNDQIDGAIQYYDDLVGYVQVLNALKEGVPQEMQAIAERRTEAERLKREILDAINRAISAIRSLQRTDRY